MLFYQSSADFESSLFANSTDGAASTSSAPGAPSEAPDLTPAQGAGDGDGFPGFTPGETAKTDYLVGGSAVVSMSATAQTQSAGYAVLSDIQGKLFVKVLFVRLGNQLISWGPSQIWTPVDFINLQKTDAFAALDTRIGKTGLRFHVPLSRGNLFAFADFSNLATNGQYTYGDPVDKTNVGGRVDFTAGDFEFGLTGYGGSQVQTRGGVDFSGRIFGTTVYGEFAAAPEYSSCLGLPILHRFGPIKPG